MSIAQQRKRSINLFWTGYSNIYYLVWCWKTPRLDSLYGRKNWKKNIQRNRMRTDLLLECTALQTNGGDDPVAGDGHRRVAVALEAHVLAQERVCRLRRGRRRGGRRTLRGSPRWASRGWGWARPGSPPRRRPAGPGTRARIVCHLVNTYRYES